MHRLDQLERDSKGGLLAVPGSISRTFPSGIGSGIDVVGG